MKKLAWIVLPLTILGCAAVNQQPPMFQKVSIEEIIGDTVRDAALIDKLQVVTYGEYRVSARRIKQTSLDCWIVHKTVWQFDRFSDARDVEVCNK